MHAGTGEREIEREHGKPDRPERHQSEFDLVPGHALAEQRTDADADGEHGEQQRDHVLRTAEVHPRIVGKLRKEDEPVEPEPGHAEDRQEHRAVAARELEIAPRLRDRIPVDAQVRRGRRRGRHAARREISGHRDADHGDRHPERRAAVGGDQHAAGDGADEDRERRARLHQRIAADQLVRVQRLRQDGVLHRAEQRRVQPHQEQRDQQQRQAAQHESGRAERHDGDLEQLDEADQPRLVVLVGELAGGGREQEERQHEQRAGEVHHHVGRHRGERGAVERDQQHQGVLEDVVVQRAEELRREERPEAALREQPELAGVGHVGAPRRGRERSPARPTARLRGAAGRSRSSSRAPPSRGPAPPPRAGS